MDSTERKGLTPRERVSTAFRRSGYLFLLAFAFRFPNSGFSRAGAGTDLLRVDILNCRGWRVAVMFGDAVLRPPRACAGAPSRVWRSAFASPVISQIELVGGCLRGAGSYPSPITTSSASYPWAATGLRHERGGASSGPFPRRPPGAPCEWPALAGRACWFWLPFRRPGCRTDLREIGVLAEQPAQVLTKQGVTFLCWLPRFYGRATFQRRLELVRQLGITSPVYWVHIELVYGALAMVLQERPDGAGDHDTALSIILLMW